MRDQGEQGVGQPAFCRDCRHSEALAWSVCRNPKAIPRSDPFGLVYGEILAIKAREENAPCGPGAQFFEPRPPTPPASRPWWRFW